MTTDHDRTEFQCSCLEAIATIDGEHIGLILKDWPDKRYSESTNCCCFCQRNHTHNVEDLVGHGDENSDQCPIAYTLSDAGRRLLTTNAEKRQTCLCEDVFLFRLDVDAAHTNEPRETALLEEEDLVALRGALEDGLSQAQNRDAEQEDVAQLLELYAGYVRDGYICPPSQRGDW
jgi:hypothetical protein